MTVDSHAVVSAAEFPAGAAIYIPIIYRIARYTARVEHAASDRRPQTREALGNLFLTGGQERVPVEG
jgi:hypothetical protein